MWVGLESALCEFVKEQYWALRMNRVRDMEIYGCGCVTATIQGVRAVMGEN